MQQPRKIFYLHFLKTRDFIFFKTFFRSVWKSELSLKKIIQIKFRFNFTFSIYFCFGRNIFSFSEVEQIAASGNLFLKIRFFPSASKSFLKRLNHNVSERENIIEKFVSVILLPMAFLKLKNVLWAWTSHADTEMLELEQVQITKLWHSTKLLWA